MWQQRLLVALLRRYGLRPYRRYRQRHTTVLVKVPVSFVNETLWPQFVELDRALQDHLNEVTDRVIRQGIYAQGTETEIER